MDSKKRKLKIAILSGKGGTGKTLLAVNLSSLCDNSNYVDCDVEEPNGDLFFKSINKTSKDVYVEIPQVDHKKCNGCRKCVDICKFNALVFVNNKINVFDNICHSCGACSFLCPQGAISEVKKPIGKIEKGKSENVNVISGTLNTGEASGTRIIKELLYEDYQSNSPISFIDCPPGSACIVMDSIKDADYLLMVTEPSVFGVKNLEMIYKLAKIFNKKCAVLINKSTAGQNLAMDFCRENNIKILGSIPYDREIANLNSDSKILVRENQKYRSIFLNILDETIREASYERTLNT